MDRRSAIVVLAVVALAAILLWARSGTPPPGERDAAAPDAARSTDSTVAEAPMQVGSGGEDAVRTEVEAAGDAASRAAAVTAGGLRIRVVWHDETPAAGIQLWVAAALPGVSRPLARCVSDAAGTAEVDGLPAGKVRVDSDRGHGSRVDVVAGEVAETTVVLDEGVAVEGVVQDQDGRPVSPADVWLARFASPWMSGAVVAHADANGAFRVRAMPKRYSLGALAPGRAPSELVDLELIDTAKSPVHVVLVVGEPGGELHGHVFDSEGQAVVGALVAVGKSERSGSSRISGTMEEQWSPRVVASDAHGGYSVDSLAPGKQPVEVWARGFPFWHGACEIVAGQDEALDIVLPAGVTVHGIVRGADQNPLGEAVVRAFPVAISKDFLQGGQYDYDSTFGGPSATTDASGHYELRNAAPGEVHLYVDSGEQRRMATTIPWAETVLQAEPGAVLEWNPVIELGHTIEGVVRYHDGTPMDGLFVILLEPGTGAQQAIETDEDGRFRFVHLANQPYDLSVQFWSAPKDAPPLGARGLWPDRGPVELTAAFDKPQQQVPGSVHGKVDDAGHRLAGPETFGVILSNEDRSWRVNPKIEGDEFTFTDVEPGRHRVTVLSGENPVLVGEWFEVAPAERKELGTLVTEPGAVLHVHIERPAGTRAIEPTLWFRPENASHSRKVEVGNATELTLDNATELTLDNMTPGPYRISGHAEGAARIQATCTVAAGVESEVTLKLRPAARREVVVDYTAEQQLTRIRVSGQDGISYFDFAPDRTVPRPYRMKIRFPLGHFTLSVETANGEAHTDFEMATLDADQPSVHVQAR